MNINRNIKEMSKDFLITWLFTLLSLATGVYDIVFRDGEKVLRVILIIFTIWIVYFGYKKSFLRKSKFLYYITLAFIFASMYMANVWDFYAIPHYDKYLHLVSGSIIALFAYVIFIYLCNGKEIKELKPITPVIFVIIFSIAAAGLWEIWEFTTDFLFGLTAQNGLVDTMLDICCGSIVGIITSIPILLHVKGRNIKFINKILDEMNEDK